MKSLAEIEVRILELRQSGQMAPMVAADELLLLAEQVLCHWLHAKGLPPTAEKREGFRLLALHRQGAQGDPSFHACRESCRELLYQYNLIHLEPAHTQVGSRLAMACAVARHLCLFIGGKLQDPELGDFCCSAKPLHARAGA